MLRRMSARRFRKWEMYAELEPFGELRADVRAAQVVQMIFNMAVAAKHRKLLKDFLLPSVAHEEVPVQRQDQFAVMKLFATAYSQMEPMTKAEEAEADKEITAQMREQVARAHAALKGNVT